MAVSIHETSNATILVVNGTINISPTDISSSFALTSYVPAAAGHPTFQALTPVGCAVVLLIFFAGMCTTLVVVRNAGYARSIRKWEGSLDEGRLEAAQPEDCEAGGDGEEGDETLTAYFQGRKTSKQAAA